MQRNIFEPEHQAFRDTARRFFETECVPHVERWERTGHADREAWLAAGKLGLIGWQFPEEYGGAGVDDFRFNAIVTEEFHGTGATGIGLGVQNDIMPSYFRDLTTEEQKQRWLPKFITGEYITAIAMSEPGAGSDLAGIRTSARRDGSDYVINGSKTFISNGLLADLILVVCRTDFDTDKSHKALSLLVVEADRPGFRRGAKLDKIGQRSADTTELFFEDVRVPAENLVGEENKGFYHLMRNLPAERLGIAVNAVAQARRVLNLTTEYARDRKAFGTPIGTFQTNRHALAQMRIELEAAQSHVDASITAVNGGALTAAEAAGAKWLATELQWRIVDRCLQMFGGYGYMNEYEIARQWRDARVQRIYGGSNEVMLDLVGRDLGF